MTGERFIFPQAKLRQNSTKIILIQMVVDLSQLRNRRKQGCSRGREVGVEAKDLPLIAVRLCHVDDVGRDMVPIKSTWIKIWNVQSGNGERSKTTGFPSIWNLEKLRSHWKLFVFLKTYERYLCVNLQMEIHGASNWRQPLQLISVISESFEVFWVLVTPAWVACEGSSARERCEAGCEALSRPTREG